MADEDVLHVATVFAELLDNDEDGKMDVPLVLIRGYFQETQMINEEDEGLSIV